jgi:hypothetical protein
MAVAVDHRAPRDSLAGRTGKRLGVGVSLDALEGKEHSSRCVTGALMTNRFVVHNCAADKLGGARRSNELLAVGTLDRRYLEASTRRVKVGTVSSAARIPLPSLTKARATF